MTNTNVREAAAAISRLADQVSTATSSREVYSILEEFNAVDDGVFERLIDLLSAVATFARHRNSARTTTHAAIDQLWELHYAIGNAAVTILEVPDRDKPADTAQYAKTG